MDELVAAPNLWGFISEHIPKSRSFLYDGGTSGGRNITLCSAGVPLLTKDLNTNMLDIGARGAKRVFANCKNTGFGTKLFGGAKTTSPDVRAQLLSYLKTSYGYLLNTADEGAKLLEQSVVANAIKDGLLYFGTSTNSQTAVANYAATRAQEQQRLTQNTLGFLAGYWLPVTKSAFEAIMYGCFLFVILLGIFPFGLAVLRNYVFTLCWLQAWAPLYAIINLICSYYARVQSLATPESGFILKNWYQFLQVNHDIASLAGYLTLSVPFIAAGLVRGMAGTMTTVSQYIGGVSQSSGGQAASEAVAGNISMGVTGFRNNSAFNLNMHQHDMTARMSSGVSYESPGGESINFMPDGSVAVSRGRAVSDLGDMNVDLVNLIQNASSENAERGYNVAQSKSIAFSENCQSGMRSLYEYTDHLGTNQGSNSSWAISESSAVTKAAQEIKDSTQSFADTHQISYDQAKEIMMKAHVDASVGIGTAGGMAGPNFKVGLEGSASSKRSTQDQKVYRDAEEHISKTGYSKNIDLVARASIDKSIHTTDEKGARIVESMGGSFEKAYHLREESQAHYQEAEGYRMQVSYLQEAGVQVRTNVNQEALRWFAEQQKPDGSGKLGVQGALGLMKEAPERSNALIKQFAHDYAKSHVSVWGQGYAHSQQDIKETYQDNASIIAKQGGVELQKHQTANKEQVHSKAEQRGLLKENFVDTSLKNAVATNIGANKQEIERAKDRLDKSELTKEQQLKKGEELIKQPLIEHSQGGLVTEALKRAWGNTKKEDKPAE